MGETVVNLISKYPIFGVGVVITVAGAFGDLVEIKGDWLLWIGIFVMMVGLVIPQTKKK